MSANISGSLGSFVVPALGGATDRGACHAKRLGFVGIAIFALDQHAPANGGADKQCTLDVAYRAQFLFSVAIRWIGVPQSLLVLPAFIVGGDNPELALLLDRGARAR